MYSPFDPDYEDDAADDHRGRLRLSLRPGPHLTLAIAVLVASGLVGAAAWFEAETSRVQARQLSRVAARLDYQLGEGPSPAIRFPEAGPFDQLLGYSRLPALLRELEGSGLRVERQARFSPALMEYTGQGFFAPFAEKDQAGLSVLDCRAEPLYQYLYPRQVYRSFEDIPPVVVNSLLFIENRGLLDPDQPHLNPAVDWSRFLKAVVLQLAEQVGLEQDNMGGSTLATQIEKYRHSPDGITWSATDKLMQMYSASVRAYRGGADTLPQRRQLVRLYLNTVPLSAAPGHGQVHGLGDGLWVWFGADVERANAVLRRPAADEETLAEQGRALRQVLALMIAHRRPSYYLGAGRDDLDQLTESHLRLMATFGEISEALRDAALDEPLRFRDFRTRPALSAQPASKAAGVPRTRLLGLLGVSLYDLDRLDLSARSTLDRELQTAVTDYLQRLRDPGFALETGLVGDRLLSAAQAPELRYSFTLFERTADSNRVRVQTDNTEQPFDINEGSKLELGSTAKLRVLTSYLEVIAELHGRYAGLPAGELAELAAEDPLSRWALDHLRAAGDRSLPAMLAAALERRYSASPHEVFFTGGGQHSFSNFRKEDDTRDATVRESLRESLNLPFVRMLQDVIRYIGAQQLDDRNQLLKDDHDPRRQDYLRRFADREGLSYLHRFWRKYRGRSTEERLEVFLEGLRPTPARLAAVHGYLFPTASAAELGAFLGQRLPDAGLSEAEVELLHERFGPGRFDLPDQGYIARVHPLELWLLGFLQQHPRAGFEEATAASAEPRQQVYGWLLRTRAKNARDSRIRTMLEVEAFLNLHQRWKRLGYPFEHLVPSLATALGSSGDRPAALAELMGIIANDGLRLPTVRIDRLHFAADTPYETELGRVPGVGERVLAPEVAAALREALAEVVDNGTARRLQGVYTLADGEVLRVGGKTGTGDNRIFSVGAGGQRSGGRALNRTATFVFYLGPRHFGTLTAFVPGRAAEAFSFTSALPVQVLKGMAPLLLPYLEPGSARACRDVAGAPEGRSGRLSDSAGDLGRSG